MGRHNILTRIGCSGALFAALVLAACGPPEQPRREAKPGALGRAMDEARRTPLGFTAAVSAVRTATGNEPIPYVVIRFNKRQVSYQDALYSALNRALERYPAAAFDIVLAMPALAAGANVEEATARGERRIEDVVLLMTDMGMPAERVRIAATTDASAAVDEIRIFVH